MTHEELEKHGDDDVDAGDFGEGEAFSEKVGKLDGPRFGQRDLQDVVEVAEPLVDLDIELDLVPGDAEDRPVQPAPIGKE